MSEGVSQHAAEQSAGISRITDNLTANYYNGELEERRLTNLPNSKFEYLNPVYDRVERSKRARMDTHAALEVETRRGYEQLENAIASSSKTVEDVSKELIGDVSVTFLQST